MMELVTCRVRDVAFRLKYREMHLLLYTHIVQGISQPSDQSLVFCCMDKVKSCCYFFLASDKRLALLTDIVQHDLPDISKRKPLIGQSV